MSSFEQTLERYADLIVRVGVNVQKDQRVVVRAPVDGAPLARAVAAAAYRAGARLVDVLWSDDQVTRSRFELAPRDSFDELSTFTADALMSASEEGAAFISLFGADPDAMKGQDPELIAKQQNLLQAYLAPHTKRVMSARVTWTVAGVPVPGWAAKIFPDDSPEDAMASLWKTIFRMCRADRPDPVQAWKDHSKELARRRAMLTEKQYGELRYRAPGTDLRIGLPEDHVWLGGGNRSAKGIDFVANLPTEEVFTLPHRDRVEGTVSSTKPLSYGGNLIQDFGFTFEKGRITEVRAREGQAVLERLVATDEGSKRLGEVALVPHSSPISTSGLLFYNTLYDENASCHVAIGRAYSTCLKGGPEMSESELDERGVNQSLTHVDFMIGSGELDIDGVTRSGEVEPLMRNGEWVG